MGRQPLHFLHVEPVPAIDQHADESSARYYNLGKSLNGRAVFSVFWTDGKRYRVIFSRPMSQVEDDYYERKKAEDL